MVSAKRECYNVATCLDVAPVTDVDATKERFMRDITEASVVHIGKILTHNPFSRDFLKWTLPSLNLDMSTNTNRRFRLKSKNTIANSIDPDEKAHYKPSHLDLHCLHRYLFWSTELKGLTN